MGEDEEMKEMLALIENAKYDLKDRDEGELMEMVEKIDDDDYYNKLKMDIKDKQQEKKRQEDLSISAAQIKTNEEDEARRKAEEEARRKAQVEAKKKIEDDAKIKSSNEVKIKDTKKELDTENKKKLELNASRKSEADSRKMALELMKRKANQAKEELEKSTVPTEPRKHILEGVTNKIVDTKRKMEEEAQRNKDKLSEDSKTDDTSNKRRADEMVEEKEPSKKRTKEGKGKKKALAVGGVSMFGGTDIFGGKNPFASRKQEESSEEDDDKASMEESTNNEIASSTNQTVPLLPHPPHSLLARSIAIQQDAQERPVSFDDKPSNDHGVTSANKNRVTLPNKRRPPARISRASDEMESSQKSGSMGKLESNNKDDQTNQLTERLGNGSDGGSDNDYDADLDTECHSTIRRGRKSIKKKQPPKGGVAMFGGVDLFIGKSQLPNRKEDSDEVDLVHSKTNCDVVSSRLKSVKDTSEKGAVKTNEKASNGLTHLEEDKARRKQEEVRKKADEKKKEDEIALKKKNEKELELERKKRAAEAIQKKTE